MHIVILILRYHLFSGFNPYMVTLAKGFRTYLRVVLLFLQVFKLFLVKANKPLGFCFKLQQICLCALLPLRRIEQFALCLI